MKKDMIGAIVAHPGLFSANRELLLPPLDHSHALIRSFCTHCGALIEVGPDYAQFLLSVAGRQLSATEFKTSYLETSGCGEPGCSIANLVVEIKTI